ncbi:MAG: sulfatase [Verrucomicrobiota bacterium]
MKKVFAGLILLPALFASVAFAGERRPNILILLAEQWRAEAFGYAGNPDVKTPNIDGLHGQSVDFKNAVASNPVCCPTRASMMTGQRSLTHGVFMNDVPLDPNAVSLAKVLKSAGYDTAYVGKWHLNGDGRSNFIPRERRQGFDYWKVLECTHDYNNSFYFADTPEKLKWNGYDAMAQTEDAQAYLRGRTNSAKPFAFMLAWGPPHDPYFSAPEKYRAIYKAETLTLRGNVPKEMAAETRRNLAGYYAQCTALDDCVCDLLQTLHETGLEKNTIVVFTADHGDMLGSHGFSKKQKPWDESICVPVLFRWPNGLGGTGRKLEAVFNSEDFMPTLLGLCDVKIPKTVEGINYSGYMRGRKNPSDNAALIECVAPFGEWTRKRGGKEYRGVRTIDFTYVRDLNGPWLFYDNKNDPLQLTNLAGQAGSIRLQKELDQILQLKLRKAGDQFLQGEAYIKKWGYQTDDTGTVSLKN